MQITSQYDHLVLLDLIDRSLKVWKDLHAQQSEKLIARYAEIDEFKNQPWYKRWVAFAEPYAGDVEDGLNRMGRNIEFLRELWDRAQYDLTITLNDDETEILFTTAP